MFLFFLALLVEAAVAETCQATISKDTVWGGGFTATATVLNSGSSEMEWQAQISFDSEGTIIDSIWSAEMAGSDITGASWNAVLQPGASTNFGFRAIGEASTATASCSAKGVPKSPEAPPPVVVPVYKQPVSEPVGPVAAPVAVAEPPVAAPVGPVAAPVPPVAAPTGPVGGPVSKPPAEAQVSGLPPRVVQYFASWAIYGRQFYPWDMDLDSITHVHYSFMDVTSSCSVESLDPWADFDIVYAQLGMTWGDYSTPHGNIGAFRILRDSHPHLKLLFSLGGWTKSTYFSGCTKDAAKRALVVSSAVDLVRQHDFDGLDIDWEYPVCCGMGSNQVAPEDWSNYLLLLGELRSALDATFPGVHKELTIAMGMGPAVTGPAPKSQLASLLDAVNLMTYDYNGAWNTMTGHNAPLYPDPGYKAAGGDPSFNIDWGVHQWLASGVDPSKLVLGLPAYGRGWAGTTEEYGLSSGAMPGSWEPGSLSYFDIHDNLVPTMTRMWNEASKVPYLVGSGTLGNGKAVSGFLSYDDEESIAFKAQYAKSLGLGGLMWWEASEDRHHHLLRAANRVWGSQSAPMAAPVAAPGPVAAPVAAPVAEPVTEPVAEPPVAEPVAPVAEPVAPVSAPAQGTADCTASVSLDSQWDGGFTAGVTVRHGAATGAALVWEVELMFPGGQTITSMWNGQFSTISSGVYAVHGASWNDVLQAGSGTAFGFQGSGTWTSTAVQCRQAGGLSSSKTSRLASAGGQLSGKGQVLKHHHQTSGADNTHHHRLTSHSFPSAPNRQAYLLHAMAISYATLSAVTLATFVCVMIVLIILVACTWKVFRAASPHPGYTPACDGDRRALNAKVVPDLPMHYYLDTTGSCSAAETV